MSVRIVRKALVHPLTPLALFAVALTGLLTTYLALGLAPSTTFEIVATFSWSLLVAYWVVADARRRTDIPCFDFGFFCYLFLPIVVPWYCFWSRGWRGAFTLVVIACLWLAPYVIASLVWAVLYA
jgi:hypothetical protein